MPRSRCRASRTWSAMCRSSARGRDVGAARELDVTSRFLVYQNRVEYETYIFVGRRNDTLRLTDNGWKIARREILLEQNILLAKNLTTFF
ncbi:aromatic-ring-hydroxylating dioxygenase subunit beta [Bradyrhizobium elkanii]